MRDSIADQLQSLQTTQQWQRDFVEKAEVLDETAETSHNPEYQHEMADTLRTLSHTDAQTVEELDNNDELEERPSNNFMIGTRFSDMEKETYDPIWDKWIYSGKITGVIGEEGTGKSTLMTALAARVSNGSKGPDGNPVRPGTVIYIGPEEDDAGAVLERLEIEGANLNNVVSLQDVIDEDFKLPTHQDLLKAAIIHYKASLVVIDPINSCIAKGYNLNTSQGARAILSPLQKMLKHVECGMVFINHFTKGKQAKTSDRGFGSKEIYNFLRLYCTLYVDPVTGKVILHEEKNNLNTGKPPDLYIEKLKSGKLFFSGAGSSDDFVVMAEQQRLSMGRQAILKIVDAAPLYRYPGGFTGAMIHQCLLEQYPNMPSATTRSLLKRMSDPDKNGKTDLTKVGYGEYCSNKRAAILAQMQQQAEDESQEQDEGVTQKPATPATLATLAVDQQKTAIIAPTTTTPQDVAQQDTMVLDEEVKA